MFFICVSSDLFLVLTECLEGGHDDLESGVGPFLVRVSFEEEPEGELVGLGFNCALIELDEWVLAHVHLRLCFCFCFCIGAGLVLVHLTRDDGLFRVVTSWSSWQTAKNQSRYIFRA